MPTAYVLSSVLMLFVERNAVLRGVVGANLIGFQTYSYARHFISCCTRVLGVESTPKGMDCNGTHIYVEIFPIGIDVKSVEEKWARESVRQKVASIRELYQGKKIIIGRDKLDQIKGVIHKLNAFEKFLERYPKWQNNVWSPTDLLISRSF